MDGTNIQKMGQLRGIGEEVTVAGTISEIKEQGFKAKKRLEITVKDDTGGIKAVWFKKGVLYEARVQCGAKYSTFRHS